jgi:hypothetical protein
MSRPRSRNGWHVAEHPQLSWIRQHFEHGLEPHEWDELVAHLRVCAECGEAYESAAQQEQPASADPDDLSPQAVERARALAMKRLTSSRLAKSPPAVAARAPARATAWVAVGATLAAAAAVVLWFSSPKPDVGPRVTGRGGGGLSADLYCATEGSSPRLVVGEEPCAPGSHLVVEAVTTTPGIVHLSVISCRGNFDCQLSSSVAISGAATLKGPRLTEGQRLRVFVIGSNTPVSEAALRHSIELARGSGRALFDVLALPDLPFSQLAYSVNVQTK